MPRTTLPYIRRPRPEGRLRLVEDAPVQIRPWRLRCPLAIEGGQTRLLQIGASMIGVMGVIGIRIHRQSSRAARRVLRA